MTAEAADHFSRLYQTTTGSRVYRDAIRASLPGLPDWVIPFSIVDGALLERFASELRIGEGDMLLDLACGGGGPGLWVAERTGAALIGIDFAPAAIDAAQQLADDRNMGGRARFTVADATQTGLPDGSVSAVMSIDALMFIDAERAANEVARVLKPGGMLVMTAAESLVDPFMDTLVRDYRPIFARAGFETVLHQENAGHGQRQLQLYRAIDERSEQLLAEIGNAARPLIDEARNGLARSADDARVRYMIFAARRS